MVIAGSAVEDLCGVCGGDGPKKAMTAMIIVSILIRRSCIIICKCNR